MIMDAQPLVTEAAIRLSEPERVELWRLEELLRADYPAEIADELAARVDIDLHQAVALVAGGCPAALAARILL